MFRKLKGVLFFDVFLDILPLDPDPRIRYFEEPDSGSKNVADPKQDPKRTEDLWIN